MPLAFSITDGIAFGFIAYAVLKPATGRARELDWLAYVFAALLRVAVRAVVARVAGPASARPRTVSRENRDHRTCFVTPASARRRAREPRAAAPHRRAAGRGVRARPDRRRRAPRSLGRQPHRHERGAARAFMWMIGHLFSLRGVTPERPVVVYEQDVRAARGARVLVPRVSRPSERPRARRRRRRVDAAGAAGRRTEPVAPVPSDLARHARRPNASRPGRTCSTRLGRPETAIVDTRSEAEYRGASSCARSAAARFPAPCTSNGRRTSRPTDATSRPTISRAMYAQLGVTPDREVVTYCQGGYRAAHTYLALRLLGFPRRPQLHRVVEGVGRSRGPADRAARQA